MHDYRGLKRVEGLLDRYLVSTRPVIRCAGPANSDRSQARTTVGRHCVSLRPFLGADRADFRHADPHFAPCLTNSLAAAVSPAARAKLCGVCPWPSRNHLILTSRFHPALQAARRAL